MRPTRPDGLLVGPSSTLMDERDADGARHVGIADLLRRWRARIARGRGTDPDTASEMAVWGPPEDAPGWTSGDAARWVASRAAPTPGTPWVESPGDNPAAKPIDRPGHRPAQEDGDP